MPEARSVCVGVWVPVGGRDEPDELSGASHFLEHLVFKGTARLSALEVAEAIDAVGGEMNAFTAREHTAYVARVPYEALGVAVGVLGEVLSGPALRPEDVDAERQVIIEEILMNADSPEDRVHGALSEALFAGHPLGRDVLGRRESVEAIRPDDLVGFFDRWYRSGTVSVVAAGRLEHAAVLDAVTAAFALPGGGSHPARSAPGPGAERTVLVPDDAEQAHLCLGWRALPEGHPDRFVLAVASQVLGGGTASRLFQQVREQRGLAYTVYSYVSAYADAGTFGVYGATAPERVGETLAVIEAEVGDLAAHGPTERELAVARGYLGGSLRLGLEDSAGRMHRLGTDLVALGDIEPLDVLLAGLDAVSAADVRRVLSEVVGTPRVLAAVGPVDTLA